MYKWDASHDEMAYVLMGDTLTKSHTIYDFIEKQVGAAAPTPMGQNMYNVQDGKRQWKGASELLGLGEDVTGLGGGASQGTAGGNQASHPAQSQPGPAQSQPGMWDRFKTWGKERAMPAMRRGAQHLGAFGAGGLVAGPAGALAGLGASMYDSHRQKQQGNVQPVFRGPGGLGELAGDAAKQGTQAAQQFGQQQAQNFQTGQGAMGKVGQAAYAGQHLAGQARDGLKRLGSTIAAPFQQAWQAGGQQQQQNLANAPTPAMNAAGMNPQVGVTQPTAAPTPTPAPTPSAVSSIQQQPTTATADPTQAAAITGGQQGGYQPGIDPYAQGNIAAQNMQNI
jgi:hypothetical protein